MQKKKGISLIVLVITIIVMIILAGAIILSLNNAGIIDKASEAVDSSNYKQLEQYITSELLLSGWTSGKTINKEELQDISGVNVLDITSDGKVVPDTWVIEKDGAKLTIYSTGEMVKGEVKFWDGSSSAPETKDGNWYIYTPEELKFLADVVNGGNQTEGYKIETDTVVYLMNDLDLGARQEKGTLICGKEWTPIGSKNEEGYVFVGTFEGNHHTIRGVYVSQDEKFAGIFGNSHTIQNLTIKDSYIKATDSCVGGIVGALRNGKIVDCHNINTYVEALYSVGGIVGQAAQIAEKVSDCTNDGDIIAMSKSETRYAQVGGITGYSGCLIMNCVNRGKIEGYNMAGGIAGLSKANIEECINEGDLVSGNVCVGGIVGSLIEKAHVINCTNSDTVDGNIRVGGIAGNMEAETRISYCKNNGHIKGMGYVGGILGLVASDGNEVSSLEPKVIEYCYNNGNINGGDYTGGIIGLQQQYSSILRYSYNVGSVTGNNYVGGLTGTINRSSKIENCYNSATIKGIENVGGIVGATGTDSASNIANVYNIGNVTGTSLFGGIIGNNKNSTTIENACYLISTATLDQGNLTTTSMSKEALYIKTTFLTLANSSTVAWEIRTGENNGYPVIIGLK